MKLLLTGFEPFAGSSINPSEQIARALAQSSLPGLDIHTTILPVERVQATEAILAALQAQRPDVVVSLGQATGRAAISIERVAINLEDYAIPDNAGQTVTDEPVLAGGPAAYFVTLPVRAMVQAVRAAGIPAELSLSAGAYLCNRVMYVVLHKIATQARPVRAGFIHVPMLPEQAVGRTHPTPTMSLETMVAGVRAALSAL
jgi:pyroglutamyl-peptidase